MRFCSHLADGLHRSSIKVYLSVIQSCTSIRVSPTPWWTASNFSVFSGALSTINVHLSHNASSERRSHANYPAFLGCPQLWAHHACCLGFFGFLQAREFTVNCAFDPSIYSTVQDLQVDTEVNPSSLQVRIKSSKTDPFRQGCFIYLGRGQAPFCPISSILAYLHRRGPSSGPWFDLPPSFVENIMTQVHCGLWHR